MLNMALIACKGDTTHNCCAHDLQCDPLSRYKQFNNINISEHNIVVHLQSLNLCTAPLQMHKCVIRRLFVRSHAAHPTTDQAHSYSVEQPGRVW